MAIDYPVDVKVDYLGAKEAMSKVISSRKIGVVGGSYIICLFSLFFAQPGSFKAVLQQTL